MRRRCNSAVAGVMLVALFSIGLATASDAAIGCGSTITKNTTLHKDLKNCPGTGIVISAPDVALDLNGHTIDGAVNSEDGVRAVADGAVVKNGVIRQFNNGVQLTSISDARVRDLKLVANGHAVRLCGVNGSRVVNNRIISGFNGILLTCTTDQNNLIASNKLVFNNDTSIRLNGTSVLGNIVKNNRISLGGHNGVYLLGGAHDNHVIRNTIDSVENDGVSLLDADANEIKNNLLTENGRGISVANDLATSDNNKIVGNTANESNDNVSVFADGIFVDGGTTATEIRSNTTNRNFDNGINVLASDAATVTADNTANKNTEFGIIVNVNTTDGGGNQASGNGNTDCINVTCT